MVVTLWGATDQEVAEQWRMLALAREHRSFGPTRRDDAIAPRKGTAPEDGWPAAEAVAVVAALRVLLDAPRAPSGLHRAGARQIWAERVAERAGRRWATAHRSARLMRERLLTLGEVAGQPAEGPGTPAEVEQGAAIERALRVIADHAADEALDRLEQAAFIDPLTGAGNRRALHADASRALAQAGRLGTGLSLVMIDLDGLKETNDRLGHAAGDRALITLVDAFRSHLRASDALYRIGGDEFVAVLAGARVADVPELVGRVAATAPPFSWGAAETSRSSARLTDLIAAADADLYERRRARRQVTPLPLLTAAGGRPGWWAARIQDPRQGKRRTRVASVAAVASLALAGGAAPLVETGVLQSALPPQPGHQGTASPGTLAPGNGGSRAPAPSGKTPALHGGSGPVAGNSRNAAVPARQASAATAPSAPGGTGPGAPATVTYHLASVQPVPVVQTAPVGATTSLKPATRPPAGKPQAGKAPSKSSKPSRPAPPAATPPSTSAAGVGTAVGTVIATVSTDVNTTLDGVARAAGEVVARTGQLEGSATTPATRSGSHGDGAGQVTHQTVQTHWGKSRAAWRSRSRER